MNQITLTNQRLGTRFQPGSRRAASNPGYQATFVRSARTAGRVGRRIGALSFSLFLIIQFFSLSRSVFIINFGDWMADVATFAGVGSSALLIPALLGYGNYVGSSLGFLSSRARVWLVVLAMTVVGLYFYGLLGQQYAFTTVTREATIYIILMICIILGSIPQVWQDMDQVFLRLFALGIVINAWGLTDIGTILAVDGYGSRSGIESQAYDLQAVLHFWPFLLLTTRFRQRSTIFFLLGSVVFISAEQILFQKRIGTFQILFYLFLTFFMLPSVSKRWSPQWRIGADNAIRFGLLGLVILVVVSTTFLAPDVISGQTQSLINRYSAADSSRVGEAWGMLEYLQGVEYLIGRGLGGYFQYADRQIGQWGVWLEDVGTVGRRELHVGALMPMLKGGLLLTLTYYAGVAFALGARKSNFKDPLGFAAYMVLLGITAFSLQGGLFILSAVYEIVLLGLCLGRCLARNEVKEATP